eukprot:SAG22_NODE_90_length_21067_cov_8.490843_3_plen_353_part_00
MPAAARTPKAGPTVANSNFVLYVFFVAAGAVKARDLGGSMGVILILACLSAAAFEMRSVKDFVKYVLFSSISIFFREIESVGAEKLPRDNPVILVCAPHSNQFLDPVTVLYELPNDFYARGRKLGFIVAAKSLRRKMVGFYARLMDGIGVERPQDLMTVGSGTLVLQRRQQQQGAAGPSGHVLIGTGTRFKAESNAGDAIVVKCEHKGAKITVSMGVVHIESDTELHIKPLPADQLAAMEAETEPRGYKNMPRVSQADCFKYCHDALGRGDCLGIFPEGGSHDRSTLLPIKAGVSIMALGTMARHPSCNVKVVPVGLTYFQVSEPAAGMQKPPRAGQIMLAHNMLPQYAIIC